MGNDEGEQKKQEVKMYSRLSKINAHTGKNNDEDDGNVDEEELEVSKVTAELRK